MKPRIAFLTGQSDPGRAALSPSQVATLRALIAHADDVQAHPHNFPWPADAPSWRAVPLLRASIANGRQYLAARAGRWATGSTTDFEDARAWLVAGPRSLLLVGSCGLCLLDALVAPFDATQRARLRIVAYGGVGPRWPRGIDGTQLRGARDRIARLLGPRDGPRPVIVDHGHMDYLDSDCVATTARTYLPWLRNAST